VTWKWTIVKIKGDIPAPREGHDMVLSEDKKKIYMFGGYPETGEFSNELFEYDVASQECKLISNDEPNAPSKRYYHTSAIIKEKLYIMGGWKQAGGRSFLEHLYCYDLKSKTWLPRVKMPTTPFHDLGISESCSIAIGESIFTYGGRISNITTLLALSNCAFLLNPCDMIVTNVLVNNSSPRAGHCMVPLRNGRILVVSGFRGLTAHDDVAIIKTNIYDQGLFAIC
jgi:N-acetylneuraminic acid mutarotase